MSKSELNCSFCGRSKSDTNLLIAGLDAHICDRCIVQANGIIEEDSKEKVDNNSLKSIKKSVKNLEDMNKGDDISLIKDAIESLNKELTDLAQQAASSANGATQSQPKQEKKAKTSSNKKKKAEPKDADFEVVDD